jgi:hypothetical protein
MEGAPIRPNARANICKGGKQLSEGRNQIADELAVVTDDELNETEVDREIEAGESKEARRTANELRRAARTKTLLWFAVLALGVTNVVTPIYL